MKKFILFTTKNYTEPEINSVVESNLKLQYLVFLTQTGTNAPVKTNVVDTVKGVVIARTGVGTYTFTKIGAFTANKTFPGEKLEVYNDDEGNKFTAQRTSVDIITLKTYAAADTSVLADGVLSGQRFNIEIFQ